MGFATPKTLSPFLGFVMIPFLAQCYLQRFANTTVVLGHCRQTPSNNPVSTRRFCSKFYFFSSALILLLAPFASLWDKRIVFSSPNIFHFKFSRCCCWGVLTHEEMTAVSPRMSETCLGVMRSPRSILLKYYKWACLSSQARKGLGAWRRISSVWRRSGNCIPSHQIQSWWEVWGPNWVWAFPEIMVAFEHMLSEGQKVLPSTLFFSMARLSRMLQGDNEPSKKHLL